MGQGLHELSAYEKKQLARRLRNIGERVTDVLGDTNVPGVVPMSTRDSYKAKIYVGGQGIYVGHFKSKTAAANAVREKKRQVAHLLAPLMQTLNRRAPTPAPSSPAPRRRTTT